MLVSILSFIDEFLKNLGINADPIIVFSFSVAVIISLPLLLLLLRAKRPNAVLTTEPATAQSPSTSSHPTPTTEAIRPSTPSLLLSKILGLFKDKGENFSAQLEEILVSSDLGIGLSKNIIKKVELLSKEQKTIDEQNFLQILREELIGIFPHTDPTEIQPTKPSPYVILFVGVNGVGKTTTIGKLAKQFNEQGKKVLLGACDTFRAAAREQLSLWADRSSTELHSKEDGAKPSTVAYEAVHRAKTENFDLLLVDTAGRLHTRVNLMNELKSVVDIIGRECPGAPHETILVVDATTGQNALQQAREFHSKANLTGIVVTKLDGTSKGGIVAAIRSELGIPIRYVGLGEGVTDLKPFSREEFVSNLLSSPMSSTDSYTQDEALSANAQVRRQRRG
jgi:fused signal recognition particle receptor